MGDATETVTVLPPVAVPTTVKSICRVSCGISLPSEQLTDPPATAPPSVVHVPPAAVADCTVRFAGSEAIADTSLEASSPIAWATKDRVKAELATAPIEVAGNSTATSGAWYGVRHCAVLIRALICSRLQLEN